MEFPFIIVILDSVLPFCTLVSYRHKAVVSLMASASECDISVFTMIVSTLL